MNEELEAAEIEGAVAPEPKISLVVGVLGVIIAIVLDVIGLIPFVDDVEELPAGMVLILSSIFGLSNVVLMVQAVAMVLKAIPIIQEVPFWTIAWCVTWYIEAHPSKLTAIAERAASVAGAVEGNVGGLEEAGAAGAAEAAGAAKTAAGAAAGTAAEAAVTAESGAAEAGEQSAERARQAKPREEIEHEMRSGEEIPPDERLKEELFNPSDVNFRQARDIEAGPEDEDEPDEEKAA